MAENTRSEIAHLYRRAGFGANSGELDAAVARGYEATVSQLLQLNGADPAADAVAPPTFTNVNQTTPNTVAARQALNQQLRREGIALVSWWLKRMAVANNPLREKLTFLWHGHFATAISKVKLAGLMYRQNQLFRTMGLGDFETLVQAVSKDPAMLVWLDSNSNQKGHPNENFARELIELFTLGIGNYTEDDVKEAARCFTGWAHDRRTDAFVFVAGRHDDGPKTFLGQTGNFGGEDVIRMVTHSAASAQWVTSRLWSHLAYPVAPDDPLVKDLARAYAKDLDVTGLLRTIFLHPGFLSAQARQGLVKQPVEYVIGAVRSFGGKGENPALLGLLTQLGQIPFDPPSVGGWPQNTYWLTTATALSRLNFAAAVAAAAPAAVLAPLEGASASDRPAALAHLLGIDGWSQQTASALAKAPTTRALVTLGLIAPEYVLN